MKRAVQWAVIVAVAVVISGTVATAAWSDGPTTPATEPLVTVPPVTVPPTPAPTPPPASPTATQTETGTATGPQSGSAGGNHHGTPVDPAEPGHGEGHR
ncbi:MAG: hypothetical protein LBI33_07735 [Propionibacteriaceae bacterium]|jgi:hypothetical protein|nr:hypothetical protein [Propionibacteriaceae bacterium]